jgi:hypothetical protein
LFSKAFCVKFQPSLTLTLFSHTHTHTHTHTRARVTRSFLASRWALLGTSGNTDLQDRFICWMLRGRKKSEISGSSGRKAEQRVLPRHLVAQTQPGYRCWYRRCLAAFWADLAVLGCLCGPFLLLVCPHTLCADSWMTWTLGWSLSPLGDRLPFLNWSGQKGSSEGRGLCGEEGNSLAWIVHHVPLAAFW